MCYQFIHDKFWMKKWVLWDYALLPLDYNVFTKHYQRCQLLPILPTVQFIFWNTLCTSNRFAFHSGSFYCVMSHGSSGLYGITCSGAEPSFSKIIVWLEQRPPAATVNPHRGEGHPDTLTSSCRGSSTTQKLWIGKYEEIVMYKAQKIHFLI